MSKTTHYVYLIQSGDMKISPVKVGYSKNPEARLKQLQTGNPVELKLIMKLICDDENHARNLEKSLHEMLSTQNVYLEWYKLKKTHIMKMLTALANNKEFDQVAHCENMNAYSSMPGHKKLKKKYRGLRKYLKQMEAGMIRRGKEASIMRRYIHEHTDMNSMTIKNMIRDELGPADNIDELEFEFDDE